MEKGKTLFMEKMGMDDNMLVFDIKNHRVRVTENIDIIFEGKFYNMFFEFTARRAWRVRTTNKRTGKPLKHPITETVNPYSIGIDTQFEKPEIGKAADGTIYKWESSWRNSKLEHEAVYDKEKQPDYTKQTILDIINTYAIEKYNKLVFIDEAATEIIKKEGGNREKAILANLAYFGKSETWNNEHKVITAYAKKDEDGHRDTCDIDIITGKICG